MCRFCRADYTLTLPLRMRAKEGKTAWSSQSSQPPVVIDSWLAQDGCSVKKKLREDVRSGAQNMVAWCGGLGLRKSLYEASQCLEQMSGGGGRSLAGCS